MKKLILILFILTVSLSFAQAQLTVNPFLGTCNPVCSFVAEKNPYFRINNPETTIKYGIELHKQNQRLAYKSGIYYQNSGSSIYTEIPEYLRNTDLKYSQSNIIAATTYAFLAGSDILLKNFNISQRYSLQTKAGVALNFLLTMNGASMPTSTNIAGMVDTLWVNDTIINIRRGGLAISVNFDILLSILR